MLQNRIFVPPCPPPSKKQKITSITRSDIDHTHSGNTRFFNKLMLSWMKRRAAVRVVKANNGVFVVKKRQTTRVVKGTVVKKNQKNQKNKPILTISVTETKNGPIVSVVVMFTNTSSKQSSSLSLKNYTHRHHQCSQNNIKTKNSKPIVNLRIFARACIVKGKMSSS